MSYYDRWDDRNREAEREGRKHGERGYGYDWELKTDHWSERGAAYRTGVREGERTRERREEERQEEQAAERRAHEEARRRREEEEERYPEECYVQEQESQGPEFEDEVVL